MLTNLNGEINAVASVAIAGGSLVSLNANGEAIKTTATTATLVGIAKGDAEAGEVVAVKVSHPVAKVLAIAGSYTAGASVYLDADGKITATKGSNSIECGWVCQKSETLANAGEITIALK